jgi:hypothetical protein
MINTQNSRIAHHRLTTPGSIFTIPATNDFTDGSWIATDLTLGEIGFNIEDDRAFFRSNNGIIELATTSGLNRFWERDGEDIRLVENLETSPVIYPNLLGVADSLCGLGTIVNKWKELWIGDSDLNIVIGNGNTISLPMYTFAPGNGIENILLTTGSDALPPFGVQYEIPSGNNIFIGSVQGGYPALTNDCIVLGAGADRAAEPYSIAIGSNASTLGSHSIALGVGTTSNTEGIAIGYSADAPAGGIAIGKNTSSSQSSIAIGYKSNTSGNYSTASGYYASTSGVYSVSNGYYSTASGDNSISIGTTTAASAASSVAIGDSAAATHIDAIALGTGTTTVLAAATHVNILVIKNCPTSAAGLPSGAVWSNSGILTIVP